MFAVGATLSDNLHDITDKAYDEAAGNGQNAVPFAIEVSGNLSADANWTLWHIAVNAATNTQRGEILNIVTLGNEVLK